MTIRSMPPASSHLADMPVPAPPPMMARPLATLARKRVRISVRVGVCGMAVAFVRCGNTYHRGHGEHRGHRGEEEKDGLGTESASTFNRLHFQSRDRSVFTVSSVFSLIDFYWSSHERDHRQCSPVGACAGSRRGG